MDDPRASQQLAQLMRDPDPQVAQTAIELVVQRRPRGRPALAADRQRPERQRRRCAHRRRPAPHPRHRARPDHRAAGHQARRPAQRRSTAATATARLGLAASRRHHVELDAAVQLGRRARRAAQPCASWIDGRQTPASVRRRLGAPGRAERVGEPSARRRSTRGRPTRRSMPLMPSVVGAPSATIASGHLGPRSRAAARPDATGCVATLRRAAAPEHDAVEARRREDREPTGTCHGSTRPVEARDAECAAPLGADASRTWSNGVAFAGGSLYRESRARCAAPPCGSALVDLGRRRVTATSDVDRAKTSLRAGPGARSPRSDEAPRGGARRTTMSGRSAGLGALLMAAAAHRRDAGPVSRSNRRPPARSQRVQRERRGRRAISMTRVLPTATCRPSIVLGRQQEPVAEPVLEGDQRAMRGIRRDAGHGRAVLAVEPRRPAGDRVRALAATRLGDVVALSQTAGVAKTSARRSRRRCPAPVRTRTATIERDPRGPLSVSHDTLTPAGRRGTPCRRRWCSSTSIQPSCSLTMPEHTARPRPVPPWPSLVV